ncbi:MAG: Peptide/nickel transport system substrate-binding protein [Acidimicrobiaceae bacterium]|jgi:peptide/nickel transport system substrate-binding protein|nr:Peptide/nickel transport system substrate-binding protein [Acidimicrobiaceae bacterium]
MKLAILNRKSAAVIGTAAALLSVAAYGPAAHVGATVRASASSGADLTLGWAEPPDTLNPATTGNRDVGPIDVNIFDTLVWDTPQLAPTPDLATKWTISPDGKTYTFTLRHGVKFQDGTPFNAAAVVSNIGYITAKTTQSTISLALLGPCLTAKAISTYTVTLSCTTAYAPLLTQLGEPYMGIQSPTAITKYGKGLGNHPVGTGPFEFVSYVPNQSVVLKRNPAYEWAPPAVKTNGPSKIAKLTFDVITNSQSRVGSLQSGQTQLIQETPGIYYKSLASQYTPMAVGITGMGIFAPINTQAWPTNDLAVRQAILYSVNKTAVIKLADDGAFPVDNTPLQKGTPGYDASIENMYPYDPAKADKLLSADGWKKVAGIWTKGGRQLALKLTGVSTVPEYPLLAQAIQSSLAANGMKASVVQEAVPAWLATNAAGQMSLTPLQYIATDPDALHLWFLPKQYYNWSKFTNSQLTGLIQKGQITSGAGRLAIYDQAQKIIMQQAVEMPIHENEDLLLLSKSLRGVSYSGGGFEYFYTASIS